MVLKIVFFFRFQTHSLSIKRKTSVETGLYGFADR